MKHIAVIGVGFVGNALREGMQHAFNIMIYDRDIRKRNCTLTEMVRTCDGPIFICVPTPMNQDGSCNTSIVESVIKEISYLKTSLNIKTKPTVVIKSTVVPGTTLKLGEKFDNVNVCFNPEFLREASAVEDFKNQDRVILGGKEDGLKVLRACYKKAYPKVAIFETDSTNAEMVKYTTNCFLATKVSFANEIKQVCDKLNINYDEMIKYATLDKRLGDSHWAVPGKDGLCGFGLACFPKDLNALMFKSYELEIDPIIMKAVWEKNNLVRPEKDWEKLIGRSVNG